MAAPEDERAFFLGEDDDDSEFNSDEEYDARPPPTAEPSATGQDTGSPDGPPNPNPNLPHHSSNQPLPPSSDSAAGLVAPSPDRKRRRTASESEETRRIFQKLWTDEDEITILEGFLEFTTQRGTTYSDYQYDTGPFFDQIRPRLQFEFNKNQLVEKLRRLKRKYRNAASRIAAGKESVFKSPHDRATFEISRKIWSSSFKRARKRRADRPPPNTLSIELLSNTGLNGALGSDTNGAGSQLELRQRSAEESAVEITVKDSAVLPVTRTPSSLSSIPSIVDETVRSCLSPLFKELLHCVMSGPFGSGGVALNPVQLNLPVSGAAAADERWKQQQILELEVLLKRTELVQEQTKSALEKLRSTGN